MCTEFSTYKQQIFLVPMQCRDSLIYYQNTRLHAPPLAHAVGMLLRCSRNYVLAFREVASFAWHLFRTSRSVSKFPRYAAALPGTDPKTAVTLLDEALRLALLTAQIDAAQTLRRKGARPVELSPKESRHVFTSIPLETLRTLNTKSICDLFSPVCWKTVAYNYLNSYVCDVANSGFRCCTDTELSFHKSRIIEFALMLTPQSRFAFVKHLCRWIPRGCVSGSEKMKMAVKKKTCLISAFLNAGDIDINVEDGVCFLYLVQADSQQNHDEIICDMLRMPNVDPKTRNFRAAFSLFVLNGRGRDDVIELFVDKLLSNDGKSHDDDEYADEKARLM